MATAVRDWLERFVPSRRAAVVCFALALAVYGFESIAWPLAPGRDGSTYLMYYLDMWHAHPAFPALMLYRMPLAPLLYGVPLQLGGPVLAEAVAAVAYGISILAFSMSALLFGRLAAIVTTVALLAYPGYGALFHQISSDPAFAFVYSLWTLATLSALLAPSTRKFAVAGVTLLLLVLARPGSLILLVFAFAPLLLGGAWRSKLVWAGSFLGVSVALLAVWVGYNGLRYGDFTVARFGSANIPFLRVFEMEKLVRAENGPASAQLAHVVENDLLTKPPYTKLGITTADQFFRIGSDRMWSDLVVVTDRKWGWGSDNSILRRVALETIRRHPRLYLADVAGAVWYELRRPYVWDAPAVRGSSVHPTQAEIAADAANVGGRYWWLASTPSGAPPVRSRVDRLNRELAALERDVPNRSDSPALARILNGGSRLYPWMAIWLALGAVALALRRPVGSVPLLVSGGLALGMIVVTELGEPPALQYGLPFQPVFTLFCVAALVGRVPVGRRLAFELLPPRLARRSGPR